MADEGIIRPPDQVSAGATPAAPDQGGIIDALRSRGPLPQAALSNIMTLPMQANLGTAFGSGVLNPQGPNPYLASVQQGNKDQFYQQLNMQRLQDQRAERQMRMNEATVKMADELLTSPDENVRQAGAMAKGRVMQQMGLPATPAVLKGLATKAVDEKQLASAARYLDMFKGDVNQAAQLSGVPVAVVQELVKGKDSDAYSRMVYGKSLIERRKALDSDS